MIFFSPLNFSVKSTHLVHWFSVQHKIIIESWFRQNILHSSKNAFWFWLIPNSSYHFIVVFLNFFKLSSFKDDSEARDSLTSYFLCWVELMQCDTPRQLCQFRVYIIFLIFLNYQFTNIFVILIIPHWLSCYGVSLCVNWINMKSYPALTQLIGDETQHQLSHYGMIEILNLLASSRMKLNSSTNLIFALSRF
jgi:hypothetical protein